MQTESKGNRKFGAHAFFAFYPNGTIHHIHDVFRDGHAKPRSLDFADCTVAFPLEGLKNMLDKLRTHADAVILDQKFVDGIA